MNDFTQQLIENIKTGHIAMRPRWQFVLLSTLWILGTLVAALVVVYLLSFIYFVLLQNGLLYAPQYGPKGWWLLIVGSPWLLVSCVALFLVVLYLLVRHYSFSYQQPWIYSILGLVCFVLFGSILINESSLHDRLHTYTTQHPVPGMRIMYGDMIRTQPGGVIVGQVIQIDNNMYHMQTTSGDVVLVEMTTHTRKSPNLSIEIGDELLIFGEYEGEIVKAFGVREAHTKRPNRTGRPAPMPPARP